MIVFMGVAGSGKSVQGRMLADKLGLPWLSTGEFLRMLVSGKRRKDMVAGKLLEDQEIIALLQKIFHMIDSSQEFVLDGFPRSIAQADWLLSQVKHGQLKARAVIHLVASETTVSRRLLNRGRADDNQEVIHKRFKEYDESIKPVLEHFKAAGVPIYEIDGEQDVAAVQAAIQAALRH